MYQEELRSGQAQKNRCRQIVLAFSLAGFAAFSLVRAETANAAAISCGLPNLQGNQNYYQTLAAAGWGKLVLLRYSPITDCAWAQMVNSSYDETIWVDHSTTGGNGWEGPLGESSCTSCAETWPTYLAYKKEGALMRACARVASGGIVCTEWR